MTGSSSLHLIVEGRVQGVGFRFFTRRVAQQLRLVGYVKNLMDGSVEVYAEGKEEDLLLLRDRIDQGPSGAYVNHVNECWGESKGLYKSFEVGF